MVARILVATCTRGEIHPLAQARSDMDTYRQSLARCTNWTVLKYGGVRRRSGTRFRGYTKFADKQARFFSHVVAEDTAYALEFGDAYIRFWLPAAQTLGGNGSGETYPITSSTINGQSIQIGTGTTPYEIVSPYAEAELDALVTASVNDVVYVASANRWPKKLSRLAHNNWTLTDAEFFDGPYEPINENPAALLTVTGSPTTGASVTFTWSAGVALTALDVGRHVRAQFRGWWVWGTIAAVASALQCTVLIKGGKDDDDPENTEDDDKDGSKTDVDDDIIPSASTSYTWRLGEFSPSNPLRFPRKVEVIEGRVAWSRTAAKTRGVFATQSNFVDRFTPSLQDGTVAEDNGLSVELLGGADPVLWLNDAYRLQVGTAAGIRTVGSSDSGVPMSARSVSSRREVQFGASEVQPVTVGTSTVYAGRAGKRLYDMFYDFNTNSLNANNLSVMSEHMLASRLKEMAYQDLPESILWLRTGDGKLRGVTLEKAEKIVGFHAHEIGGFVESILTLPGAERDELIMIVRRTVGASTYRSVETLDGPFEYIEQADAFFVDSGITQVTTLPVNTVTNLAHLEGRTVAIHADGAQLAPVTVVGGAVTLPGTVVARKITVGLPIVAEFELLRLPLRTMEGDVLGTRRRVVYADVDVYETRGLRVRSDTGVEDVVAFRNGSDPMNSAPALITDVKRVPVDGGWESEGVLTFIASGTFPATVRAINVTMDFEP